MVGNLEYKILESKEEEIPKALIREVIYGKPYYYKGYQQVLNNEKTLEDIMGSSRLQSAIISSLLIHFGYIFKKKYHIIGSESGLHLATNDNLSLDLAFYKKSDLPPEKFDNHYYEEVPELVFEVDVRIDLTKAEDHDYVFQKTQRLLDFGTQKVIWVLTKSRKVMIAVPNQSWTVDNWDKEFSVYDEKMVLEDFLKEEGLIR
jgi:hypothetical protein